MSENALQDGVEKVRQGALTCTQAWMRRELMGVSPRGCVHVHAWTNIPMHTSACEVHCKHCFVLFNTSSGNGPAFI